MAKKDEIRFRVQRFLNGPFDQSDLVTLFLFLRTESLGRTTVQDVGHMVGHADLRDQGVSVRRIAAMRTLAMFHSDHALCTPPVPIDLADASADLFLVMEASLGLMEDEAILHAVGLTRAAIGTRLTRIKRSFAIKDSGRLSWNKRRINELDVQVIKLLTSALFSKPAYSPEQLLEETSYLLLRYNFIDENQVDILHRRKNYLILFAIAAMHGVSFAMPDGSTVEAVAGWETVGSNPPHLTVSATIPLILFGVDIKLGLCLFNTDLRADQWCEDYEPGRRHISFLTPLELTTEPKLRCMV